jgi:DNA modification methylase
VTPYYEQDGITIYHGDCREVLPSLRFRARLLLSDPPYGMAFGGFRGVEQNVRADGARAGMRIVLGAMHALGPALSDDAHVYLFCHWESWPDFYDALSPFVHIKNALIWWKDRGGMGDVEAEYARDYEVILYGSRTRRALNGRRDGAVLANFSTLGAIKTRHHPTEKPVDVCGYLIGKSTDYGDLVLDPFMGSGTTLRAAKDLGRRAIGIEIEERYCEIAAKRLAQGALPMELGA